MDAIYKNGGLAADKEMIFNILYNKYYQPIYSYFFGRTGDFHSSFDLLQETFIKVWKNVGTVVNMDSKRQKNWIFTISKNTLIDYYRNNKKQQPIKYIEDDQNFINGSQFQPEEIFAQKENILMMDMAIKALPDELRLIVSMNILGEMKSSEIGDILNMPPGTVRYKLYLARKRIKEYIMTYELSGEGGDNRHENQ